MGPFISESVTLSVISNSVVFTIITICAFKIQESESFAAP